jgi:hypothetical protein
MNIRVVLFASVKGAYQYQTEYRGDGRIELLGQEEPANQHQSGEHRDDAEILS